MIMNMFSKILCKNVVSPAKTDSRQSDASRNRSRQNHVSNESGTGQSREVSSAFAFGVASRRRLPLLSQGDPPPPPRAHSTQNYHLPIFSEDRPLNIKSDPFCPDLIKQLPSTDLTDEVANSDNVQINSDTIYEQIGNDLANRTASQLRIEPHNADIHLTGKTTSNSCNIMGQRFSFFGRPRNQNERSHKPKINFSLTWVLREHESQLRNSDHQSASECNTLRVEKVIDLNKKEFTPVRHYPTNNKMVAVSQKKNFEDSQIQSKTLRSQSGMHSKSTGDNNSIITENSKTRRRKRWPQTDGHSVGGGDMAGALKSSDVSKSSKSEPSLTQLFPNTCDLSYRNAAHRSHHNHYHHHHHHTHRRRRRRHIGYDIKNIDEFLTKCSLTSPGNIPVVLSSASILYQTRIGGYQSEVPLPLGMVVNAIFKKQQWLYVQTPHAQEGYVVYESCLPLGILPPCTSHYADGKVAEPPCWESNGDVFGRPCGGNLTDSEKELHLRTTRSEGARTPKSHRLNASSKMCGEQRVDSLYLKASSSVKSVKSVTGGHHERATGADIDDDDDDYVRLRSQKKRMLLPKREFALRQTLLSVTEDFSSGSLVVKRGDVVTLLACKDFWDKRLLATAKWFYIAKRDGNRGFIPAQVAGNGFL